MRDAFNTDEQSRNRRAKIIAGIERISTFFRNALQDQAKQLQISPLQAQILIFIANHDAELCTNTDIANEFAVTKPTVSDAIKTLLDKGYLNKKPKPGDARASIFVLTATGQKTVEALLGLTDFFADTMKSMNEASVDTVLDGILSLINQLQASGALAMRTCGSCTHLETRGEKTGQNFCSLMNKPLDRLDVRVDCPDHQSR